MTNTVLPHNEVGLQYSSPADILAHSKDREVITVQLTANSVDANVYVATRPVRVTAIREVHSVVGSTGATVGVRKATGTTAPASGTLVHTAALGLETTINTVQSATLESSLATLTLAAGDRLAIDMSGTLTGLVGVIEIELQPL